MNTTTLSLETLHNLSEGLADDFRQQLESAVADCRQRPSLPDKRKVTIELIVTPHPEDPEDVLIQRARRTPKNQLQFDFFASEEST